MRSLYLLNLAVSTLISLAVLPAQATVVVTIDDFANAVLVSSDNTPWDNYATTCGNANGGTACGDDAPKPAANNAGTLFFWGPKEDPANAGSPNPNNSVLQVQWAGGGSSPVIDNFRLLTPLDRDGNPLQRLGPQAGPADFSVGSFPIDFEQPADAQDRVQQGAGVFATWGRDTSSTSNFFINPNLKFLALMKIGDDPEVTSALAVTSPSQTTVWTTGSYPDPLRARTLSLDTTNNQPATYGKSLVQGGAAGADTFQLRFYEANATDNANPLGYLGDFYFQFNAPAGSAASVLTSNESGFGSTTAVRAGTAAREGAVTSFNQGGDSSELTETLDLSVSGGSLASSGSLTTGLDNDALGAVTGAEVFSLSLAEQATRRYSFTPGTLVDVSAASGNRDGVQTVFTQQIDDGSGNAVATNTATIDTVGPLLAVSPDAGATEFGPGDTIDLGSIDVNTSTTLALTVSNLFGRDVASIPNYGDLTTLTLYNVEFTVDPGDCATCFALTNAGTFTGITLAQDSDAANPLTIDIDAPSTGGTFYGTLSFYTDQNLAFGAGGAGLNPLTVRLSMEGISQPAPAPSSLLLLGLGLNVLALLQRKRVPQNRRLPFRN